MTWEPESHIFKEDLRELWSKYGRIGTTKKAGRQTPRHHDHQVRQRRPTEVQEENV